MNYLAHAYLSFGNPGILAGNMISDFVKGKRQFEFPKTIQKGIVLHRAIDEFTDRHEATKAIKEPFRKPYRLYAGAFADVVYDYFLANDPETFRHPEWLMQFSQDTYRLLSDQEAWLPAPFVRTFQAMREQNWLYHYRFDWGIGRSFEGLVRRSAYLSESEQAFRIFQKEKPLFEDAFRHFFPELKAFSEKTMKQLFLND